jgi:peptide/nickel transport system permease protein
VRGLARLWLVLVLACGALAPLLCNDVPLVARARGAWRFPALESYLGLPEPPPEHGTWRRWWAASVPPDFAVMPPWPRHPGTTDAGRALARPDRHAWFGADDAGRDVLARLVWGASTALQVAGGALLLALALGVPLGAWAGSAGGRVDLLVLRLLELFLCLPGLLFVMAALALLGRSPATIAVVLGAFAWTAFARVVRGELLSLREREFVLAARGLGVRGPRLWLRHLLPQMRGPLVLAAALGFAAAVVVEATLSFLGYGLGVDAPSWGELLAQGKHNAAAGAWHLWLFPALVLVLTIGALHAAVERREPAAP